MKHHKNAPAMHTFPSKEKNFKPEPTRDSKEVCEMFGFKSRSSLLCSVQSGCFPEPDLVTGTSRKLLYWRLSTLNKEMKRRQESDHSRIHKGEVA